MTVRPRPPGCNIIGVVVLTKLAHEQVSGLGEQKMKFRVRGTCTVHVGRWRDAVIARAVILTCDMGQPEHLRVANASPLRRMLLGNPDSLTGKMHFSE